MDTKKESKTEKEERKSVKTIYWIDEEVIKAMENLIESYDVINEWLKLVGRR